MAIAEGQQVPGEQVPSNKVLTLDRSGDHFRTVHSGPVTPLHETGLMSPPPRPELLPSRAGNRLSLSLPIQAVERDAACLTRHAAMASGPSATKASHSLDVDQKLANKSLNEFLVALAAQERRVLELREELQRAESQLKKFKSQWALHEASRNTVRSEVENQQVGIRQMQTKILGVGVREGGKEEAEEAEEEDKLMKRSLNMDVDRRKASLNASTKEHRRKVISGGHTRALSLLSPVQGLNGQTMPVPQLIHSTKVHATDAIVSPGPNQLPTKISSNKARHSYQGSATIGVKQIAEDIKSGLWTFMEDLRQATVGEEAIKGLYATNADLTPRLSGKRGNRGNLVITDQFLSRIPQERASASRTREMDRRMPPVPADTQVLGESTETISQTLLATGKKVDTARSLDDDWSNWDSPISKEESARWSNSTALSSREASSRSSPSTDLKGPHSTVSPSAAPKRDDMSWPALNNFTPSNIKRTASAIIQEWEKSLTPPSTHDERMDLTSGFLSMGKKPMDEDSRLLLNNLP